MPLTGFPQIFTQSHFCLVNAEGLISIQTGYAELQRRWRSQSDDDSCENAADTKNRVVPDYVLLLSICSRRTIRRKGRPWPASAPALAARLADLSSPRP